MAAESEGSERGSVFTVRLPISPLAGESAPVNALELPADPVERPQSLQGLEILVVDDEPDAREVLRALLEHCGARVLSAASTHEAIALLDTTTPHIIVSDIGMPGEDGYSLIGRVRARRPDQGGRIPAVALTAYASSRDRARALARGFNHHVTKPVHAGELLTVLASLVERFGLR